MRCPNCGASTGPDDHFCPQCGSPLEQTCPQCGQSVSPGAKFCPNCGHSLSSVASSQPSAPQRAPAGPPPPPPPPPPPTPSATQMQGTVQSQPYGAGEVSPIFRYKGVLPRFGAALVDGLIMMILGGAVIYLLGLGASRGGVDTEAMAMISGFMSILGLVYQIGFEAGGSTPGKKILGMRIVDKNGNKPGLGKSIIRNLLRIIDALPFVYLLGIILVASSDRKQRLGDRAAGTYVVAR